MGYDFTINSYYKVKVKGEYPWPCGSEPSRTILLFTNDVLTKNLENGTFMKHTGLGCFGIILKDEDVIYCEKPVHLAIT